LRRGFGQPGNQGKNVLVSFAVCLCRQSLRQTGQAGVNNLYVKLTFLIAVLCGLVAVAALLVARTLLPDGGGVMFAAGFLVAYAGLLKQYLFKTFPSNLNKEEVSVFVRDCKQGQI
jgi:hypothetical protein